IIFTALIMLALCGVARATEFAIEGLRFGEGGGKTRIVMDFNGRPDFRAFLIDNPKRLAVDLPAAQWKTAAAGMADSPLIKGYRSGRTETDAVPRIVFDLRRAATIKGAFVLDREATSKDRLVMDIRPSSQNAFTAATERVWGNRNIKSAAVARALGGMQTDD